MSQQPTVSGKWLVIALGVLIAGTVTFVLSTSALMHDVPPVETRARLPKTIDPALLPEPGSEGARLLQRYCVGCHALPDPAQHPAAAWPRVLADMEQRVHSRIMRNVPNPSREEWRAIEAYLQAHGAEMVGEEAP